MSYKNIKGIIVQIGGDTSGLQKALKDVNSKTASLSKELRGINSMLKLDPKSTELLSQKQKVLKDDIKETTKYLNGLKEAQRLYIQSGGNLNTAEYRSLKREIIETENKLKQFKLEASNWTKASKGLSEFSSKMKSVGDTISNIGKKVSVVSAAVAGLFTAGVKYNADIETYTTAFKTFLGSIEDATDAVNKIKKQSETSPFDTKELIQANQMLITTGESADDSRETISALADAIALTGGGNDELSRMASNLQQIRNAGKATSMDIRQFAYAGIDVYGILSETTGKSIKELKEMDITYEDLSKALITASKQGGKYYNGQAQMAETLTGQISRLKKTFQDLLGELSQSLMPIIKRFTDKLQGLVNWFKNLNDKQKDTITKIGLFIAALGPALVVIGKFITFGAQIFSALSKISSLIAQTQVGLGGLSSALTFLSGPVGIIVAAIAALTAVFVYLYNTNERFRTSINDTWGKVVDVFNNSVKPAFDNLMVSVKELWENFIKPFGEFLWNFWAPMLELTFDKISSVFGTLFTQWQKILGHIMNALSGLIDFITGVFSGNWEKAWRGITEMVSNIFGAVVEYVKIPVNVIIDLLNNAIKGINMIKIPDWVPNVGGKGINIPLIPKLAKGGIVDKATLAMIGEGKTAEAVIPLDRTLTKYMAEAMKQAGGTRNIIFNFYPQQMTESELDRALNYIDKRYGLAY